MARKKGFTCGHKGLGKFCHRCAQADDALSVSGDEKKLKALAKARNVEPKDLAETLKKQAEKLKLVPQKKGAVVAVNPQ